MIVAKHAGRQVNQPIRATVGRRHLAFNKRAIGPMAQIALAGLLIAILLLAYVTEKNIVMSYAYELDDLQMQLKEDQIYRDRLALQIMGLESLEKIDQIARTQLGMVEPINVRYVAMAPENGTTLQSGGERVVTQIAEYISDLFASVVKAAGLHEGR